MKDLDPKISKYFSDMAKKRKNPYHPFSDKELAREAGRKGAAKRWHEKNRENTDTESAEENS